MLLIVPIRTESEIRRNPLVNMGLITLNVLVFVVFNEAVTGGVGAGLRDRYLALHSIAPAFYQFFTYQFVHADAWHLVGNLLFLWVFGNSVNSKMGNIPYLLFYLSGGVFAAWGYAFIRHEAFHLVGASGAIAAITTAYLALFPRSRVTVLIWIIFIYFVDVSAMIIIGLKIILWDNILAPQIGGATQIAHYAHLAGYLFGFIGALGMLFVRAVPRDQFDILALWRRWHQRRQLATVMAQPGAVEQARYGAVARIEPVDPQRQAAEDRRLDQIANLRTQIATALQEGRTSDAAERYETLMAADAQQCLAEREQLAVARELYSTERFEQAAAAFERFMECYPRSTEAGNVRLLLGIIYARDLHRYDRADEHLTKTWKTVRDELRREQCLTWLKDVRAALGRPAPET